jgi:hypothetical protein
VCIALIMIVLLQTGKGPTWALLSAAVPARPFSGAPARQLFEQGNHGGRHRVHAHLADPRLHVRRQSRQIGGLGRPGAVEQSTQTDNNAADADSKSE